MFVRLRVQMKESLKPQRLSQQLERAITTVYKPVANHDFNVRATLLPRMAKNVSVRTPRSNLSDDLRCVPQVEYEKKKKSEGKMVRAERQVVLDMLFSAFEKHQYYNIKDLVDITKQPVVSKTHEHKRCRRQRCNKQTIHLPTIHLALFHLRQSPTA